MGENLFEIVGEWSQKRVAKRRKERKSFKEKYWKLPAMERMHYDSCHERIRDNNHWSIFNLTFAFIKMMILVPLGIIAMGFIIGDILPFMDIARNILFSFMSIVYFVFIADLVIFGLFLGRTTKYIRKLNRRFKLIK